MNFEPENYTEAPRQHILKRIGAGAVVKRSSQAKKGCKEDARTSVRTARAQINPGKGRSGKQVKR